MEIPTLATQDVQITSVFFDNNPAQRRFESYPRRIVYRGREYTLKTI